MIETFKTVSDFAQGKKALSQKAYARFVEVARSDHTEQELQKAAREYFEASSAYLAISELLIELVDKGFV